MTKGFIICAMLIAGCQAADRSGNMEQSTPTIPALSEYAPKAAAAWNSEWAAGNSEAIGNQYADDAIVYPPGEKPVVGRVAITAYWAGALAFSTNGKLESVEADNDGSIGYEVGNYTTEDSTGARIDNGNYLTVWKYVDGSWKIYRDTWSTNLPQENM
jgi:ketosteroid isomerase-like protein